ncbi:ATP-binding cassette domain-containing protein [Streptomyces sp. NBC_00872]|uniref:ATP-binding cassette domain-containing protein n=1 Tax=Streptomyces sp. NBC_00872 TaxID=2903686 RepID=UPI00386CDDC4|nr:ABC transporter ATP-binding protein [Streptomyces sp. NBC_00872]
MELRGVGRRYGLGGPWVLRGIDLDLPPRALIRVEGTNGTGKSTLLRLLAGIDTPTEGRLTGRPRTAYVPERFPVSLPFTALGYLVHLGRIHGMGRVVAETRAVEWLERFGAAGHARTPMSELSKGTSQKVAVAQALLAGPELLVLDEAWTGLDSAARTELDRAVAERIAEGGTVVFVDHDPLRLAGAADEVYALVDRGLVRRTAEAHGDGGGHGPRVRIVAVGPPGAPPPGGLPGSPAYEPGPDGAVALTAPAVHSDALLRALLTARPPWHIREVRDTDSGDDRSPADRPPSELPAAEPSPDVRSRSAAVPLSPSAPSVTTTRHPSV